MSPETWIVKQLTENAAVKTIVGGKVFPPRVPQRTAMPYVTYQRLRTIREDTLNHPDALPKATFAILCWTDSTDPSQGYAQAVDLADKVRLALQGKRIETTDHCLDYTKLADEFDAPQATDDGDDAIYHCRQLNLEIHFAEAVLPFGA